MMDVIIKRYLAGGAIARLAREFNLPYGTLRQRLVKVAAPARRQGQHEVVSELDRFWLKTMPEPMSGCWLWIGNTSAQGYGTMYFHGENTPAHRAAWQLHRGPIGEGKEIDHLCKTRACVNPDHLRVITKSANLATRDLVRTHCLNGHPLTDDNCYFERDGRRCKTCRKNYRRKS
jgi:hypothetical protein